ncbi:MAG: DUF4178 domain-containing protein [Deltaproteobacteria bacterium]|nr:DUF4178 domain-containing protein [Nannocystaceae bacterium]
MNDAQPGAPIPRFRDEAQVEAVQCPSCGGPITRSGFGAIEKVVCPYCGSELAPSESGALALLQAVRRQQRQSVLPLHARAELDGATWELIGIVWRETSSEGTTYPWQELLLFNPYLGYRWLLFFVYDRHWALGRPLDGAPKLSAMLGRKRASWRGATFKHFQSSLTRVTYVEGEFPWQVRAGDQAVAHDYVAPPEGLSVEESRSEDGAEVAYTQMEHLDGAAVWRAFKLRGDPPRPIGVGPFRPNPWRRGTMVTLLSTAVMFGLWLVISIAYSAARDDEVVFQRSGIPFEPLTEEIVIGKPGEVTTLDVQFTARPLNNAWAFAEVILVPKDSDEAIGVGIEVDQWHGVESGESWSEGTAIQTVALGAVPGGSYTLQVMPQAGQGTTPSPTPGMVYDIRVRRDVVLLRYVFIPLVIIFGVPFVLLLVGGIYEAQRWKNSDYAPSS